MRKRFGEKDFLYTNSLVGSSDKINLNQFNFTLEASNTDGDNKEKVDFTGVIVSACESGAVTDLK